MIWVFIYIFLDKYSTICFLLKVYSDASNDGVCNKQKTKLATNYVGGDSKTYSIN